MVINEHITISVCDLFWKGFILLKRYDGLYPDFSSIS
jgi:hypothetical protein